MCFFPYFYYLYFIFIVFREQEMVLVAFLVPAIPDRLSAAVVVLKKIPDQVV